MTTVATTSSSASSSAGAVTPASGGFRPEAFSQFVSRRDEPAWLVAKRQDAFARFQALPLPGFKDEEWKRTDIRSLKPAGFAPDFTAEPTAPSAVSSGMEGLWTQLSGHYGAGLLHQDGRLLQNSAQNLPNGVIFCGLEDAVLNHPDLVKPYLLTDAVDPHTDSFSALHAALWSHGCFLYVPRGVKLSAPLFHLIGLSASRHDSNHTLVVLEEGAEAALVQETASRDRADVPGMHLGSVELILKAKAKLQFVNIQNWDEQMWHFSRERAVLDEDASLQWTVGAVGSRVSKVNQDVALRGRGAKAQVNGVMFTTGNQHLAYMTRQDHLAPNTHSDLLYKGGLKGRSRIVWKGMIGVAPAAQKTDAYQKNDSLVLSNNARADSIPGLEIEANDVRCTHGATAGQVDSNMIVYCQSRGIPKETAIQLIVEGFFANVYDRILIEPVQETLRNAVAEKLRKGENA